MEEQATRTALVQHKTLAQWALDALASRAEAHFAHLRSPIAVMNCTLCRTSMAGAASYGSGTDRNIDTPSGPALTGFPSKSPSQRKVSRTALFCGVALHFKRGADLIGRCLLTRPPWWPVGRFLYDDQCPMYLHFHSPPTSLATSFFRLVLTSPY